MKLDKNSDMSLDSLREQYWMQRTNDLLEQVELLKGIDTGKDPSLRLDISVTMRLLYESLDKSFDFC